MSNRFLRAAPIVLLALISTGCMTVPALYSVDPAQVSAGISQGQNPNQVYRDITPLAAAASAATIMPAGMSMKWLDQSDPRYIPPARRVEVARMLLAAGANPNQLSAGFSGYMVPPLTIAATYCQPEVARVLLERGADPVAAADGVGTALHALVTYCPKVRESEAFVDVLLGHVEKTRGRAAMLEFANRRAVSALAGASKPEGLPAMHLAVWFDRPGVLAGLLRNRVDMNLPGRTPVGTGWTPMHIASALGRIEMSVALMKAGARMDLVNDKGQTPTAVAGRFAGSESKATQFIKAFSAELKTKQPLTFFSGINDKVTIEMENHFRDPHAMVPFLRSEPLPIGWSLQAAIRSSAVEKAGQSLAPAAANFQRPAGGQYGGGAATGKGGIVGSQDVTNTAGCEPETAVIKTPLFGDLPVAGAMFSKKIKRAGKACSPDPGTTTPSAR